ncbi:MAG: glycoside hydrolase family 15 protein [Deltaproteobacteria bacterium]|nr:MAG: glycoside hydrolase family 15 protein [Deltaproteobacteria bacterium]
MPRALTLGNGDLLVNFDARYNMVDLYWPYVGRENQTDGHACRMGIWADGKFAWIEDGAWQKQICYRRDTLVSDVVMENAALGLRLRCSDAVDFHEPLLVREVNIEDLAGRPRDVRVFWHHDLRLFGYDLGDTVFFDPKTRCLVHYKAKRYAILGCFGSHGFGAQRWATGKKGFSGAQGTFVDAEDGVLSQNPIEQGSVDSTMGVDVQVPASGKSSCAMFLGMGETYGDVREQAERLRARSTAVYLRRTDAFWRLWVARDRFDYGELPAEVVDLFLQSLLILRTQIDNRGAIIAANDHDITSFARDTYSYMWPRDGSIVAAALDAAGHVDVTSHFYKFCARSVTADGYLLHKYNPDGSTASSWHPWVGAEGTEQLPIQEDETALVLWALWQRFLRRRDVEMVKPLFRAFMRSADFLASWRDPSTGLPWPSYDLWEERRGVLTWTCGAVVGGLRSAQAFAVAFGENEMASRYGRAADEIVRGMEERLWNPSLKRFARMLARKPDGSYEPDMSVDASLYGAWRFGAFAPDDPKVEATMLAIREKLWVRTDVGGVARYESDPYQQRANGDAAVPGNPWFICTLWLAQHGIAKARSVDDLRECIPLLAWVSRHALPSGILAEQLHPYTGEPLSVSPLTWSHAEFVASVLAWLEKREALDICPTCGTPRFFYRQQRGALLPHTSH